MTSPMFLLNNVAHFLAIKFERSLQHWYQVQVYLAESRYIKM